MPDQSTATPTSGTASVIAPQDVENPDYEEPEVEPTSPSSYTGPLHFRGNGNSKSPLLGHQPFLLYWKPSHNSDFYPIGLWDNRDFSPQTAVSKSDILQFRIMTKAQRPLTAADLTHTSGLFPPGGVPLEWKRGNGSWQLPTQRKGQNYYISVAPQQSGGPWRMAGIRRCHAYDDGIRFALWMDIVDKGDAWISDQDTTGSIRMQTPNERRASLVAVRYGTSDPFGQETMFWPRSWSDLIG
ncbi:hypothetical protein GFY24_40025 [Nocardia sp. SYP-A9097]|uniref:hypothetical protein n=1 Tax=Nocardia sp. SYP-A9097 TaxID=2663237 RepID=UPI00129B9E33|nr:hypothetical protein [Nocardia sp. SYP-A9097]MRH93516.1 hypothetical protein [Nocardia sp. SYP-A9097]